MQPDFDILVVGAGVAGTTSAILLARAGWRVMLVDPDKPIHETGESLPAQARPLLEALDLWNAFLTTEPLAIALKKGVWGPNSFEHSEIYSPYGMGWIVDKARWVGRLRRAALINGAELLLGSCVTRVRSSDAGAQHRYVEAELAHCGATRVIRAACIVDATGQRAFVAKQLGALRQVSAPLSASLWYTAAPAAHTEAPVIRIGTASEHWWYAAPLPAGGVALTLYGTAIAPRRQEMKIRGLLDVVADQFGIVADWSSRPIRLSAASGQLFAATGPQWVAVGDAACSFDPLASTGLLQALRGAARVSCAIAANLSGDDKPLEDYAVHVRTLFDQFTARRARIYAVKNSLPSHIGSEDREALIRV